MKVIWQFNPVTIGAIFTAAVSGAVYMNTMDNRIAANAGNIAAMALKLNNIDDLPYRMKTQETRTIAQEEKDNAQNARMDRIADLVMSGQEAMRKDVQSGFDSIRKDLSTLSTKVEVVGSKVDIMSGKPQPGSYRMIK